MRKISSRVKMFSFLALFLLFALFQIYYSIGSLLEKKQAIRMPEKNNSIRIEYPQGPESAIEIPYLLIRFGLFINDKE